MGPGAMRSGGEPRLPHVHVNVPVVRGLSILSASLSSSLSLLLAMTTCSRQFTSSSSVKASSHIGGGSRSCLEAPAGPPAPMGACPYPAPLATPPGVSAGWGAAMAVASAAAAALEGLCVAAWLEDMGVALV